MAKICQTNGCCVVMFQFVNANTTWTVDQATDVTDALVSQIVSRIATHRLYRILYTDYQLNLYTVDSLGSLAKRKNGPTIQGKCVGAL